MHCSSSTVLEARDLSSGSYVKDTRRRPLLSIAASSRARTLLLVAFAILHDETSKTIYRKTELAEEEEQLQIADIVLIRKKAWNKVKSKKLLFLST